ncbi:hypothetical protein Droror1_Dr00028243 [Drosera rotundifolia]
MAQSQGTAHEDLRDGGQDTLLAECGYDCLSEKRWQQAAHGGRWMFAGEGERQQAAHGGRWVFAGEGASSGWPGSWMMVVGVWWVLAARLGANGVGGRVNRMKSRG